MRVRPELGAPAPRERVRTPTVLQMEAVECGAAALAIVLGYYGRFVPLAELRAECGVSRDGVKASSLVRAARRYGLHAQGLRRDLAGIRRLTPPFIVFWQFDHFVVVDGFGADCVHLNDPATGPRTVPLAEFDEAFTGVALAMGPGPDFTPGGAPPSVLHSLRARLAGSVGALAFCVVAGLLLVLPGIALPVFIQVMIDDVLAGPHSEWARPLVLGMVVVVALQAMVRHLQLAYLRRLRTRLAVTMSARFLWHVLRLPVGFFAQRFAGEIGARGDLNDDVADALSGRLMTTLIEAMMAAFYAMAIVYYDLRLAAIAVAAAIVDFLALRWVARRHSDAHLRLGQETGKVAGVAIAGIESIETIKASGLESAFFSRWSGYFTKAYLARQQLSALMLRLGVLPGLLQSLAMMVVLVAGGLRVMDGSLSVGMLMAVQGLLLGFLAPVETLVGFGYTLSELRAHLLRLDDVLNHPEDPLADHAGTIGVSAGEPVHGSVELRDVTFGYSRVDPPLLKNLSLSVRPGQRVALVGGSGSGKSTVARLACGLYRPWAGEVLIDGHPLDAYPRPVLARSLALVDQDVCLFAGTVMDNLTLWDDTVRHEDLIRACVDAEIWDVVRGLPEGLNAEIVVGGGNLSGGERQRLEIARALVSDPAILVLDEATSALDAETEVRIIDNLRRRGCSAVVVAHRLSTIRDCDEIIVLRGGEVVQRGTHRDLWRAGGEYTRLIQDQDGTVRGFADGS